MSEKKVRVRYYTRSGNTKKVADAIAKVYGVTAKSVPVPVNHPTDVLFLGASVYAGGIDQKMKDYISNLDPEKVKKVVVFSTSALAQRAYPQIEKELKKRGIPVASENFYCRGQFSVMHRGRPNQEDLKAAETFARSVIR